MKRVLVISDSHGNMEITKKIVAKESADLNIHAGDYCCDINEMKRYFDYFVDGNNDYSWKNEEIFVFENFKFLLIHGDRLQEWNRDQWYDNLRQLGVEYNVDIVIFGHSHVEYIDIHNKPFLLNPGSIALPRGKDLSPSYAVIEIDKQTLRIQIKHIKEI